jgi:hypothetical protein
VSPPLHLGGQCILTNGFALSQRGPQHVQIVLVVVGGRRVFLRQRHDRIAGHRSREAAPAATRVRGAARNRKTSAAVAVCRVRNTVRNSGAAASVTIITVVGIAHSVVRGLASIVARLVIVAFSSALKGHNEARSVLALCQINRLAANSAATSRKTSFRLRLVFNSPAVRGSEVALRGTAWASHP